MEQPGCRLQDSSFEARLRRFLLRDRTSSRSASAVDSTTLIQYFAVMSHKPASLLTASDIASMPGTQKTHFLNPRAQRLNKSLGDATGLQNMGVHHVEVPPGAWSTEQHRHFCEKEAVYVLSGMGLLELDDEVLPIAAGDFVGLPAGGPAQCSLP